MPYQLTMPFASREIRFPTKSNRELNMRSPPFVVVSTPVLLRYGSRMRFALPLSFALADRPRGFSFLAFGFARGPGPGSF